ncbi:TRAP transporter substrate-binding protein DctP [Nocardioides panacisoli]|uniref:TRAP transporter substrate-binding protein DctP n=1 Tax=Nocardioides panacisoli TaxID=627624 RepID=UPI001C632074|nr:TRAP transporter substrate-binding protein DctP [Nocardioides panacisoli]QYJ03591.1 TRAP transporter substrate-binding protein DctP [Nocardioides panacisoli]
MQRIAGIAGAAALSLSVAACGGVSEGSGGTVRLSSYLPQDTGFNKAVEAWADQTEECADGEIEFERFFNGALFGATETRDALGSGRIEVGSFSVGYHPGEFPLTQGLFDVPFLSSNVSAVMDAQGTIYEDTAEAQAEWNDQGMELLKVLPVTSPPVGTNTPFEALEDLRGQDLRGYPPGGVNAAIEAAGAEPVDLDLAELPEAMQRGVVDGYAGVSVDTTTALSLQENTKYLTEAGFGATSAIQLAVNKDWWDGLSDEARGCASDAAEDLQELYVSAVNDAEAEACGALSDAGVEMSVLPEAETEKLRSAIFDEQRAAWIESAEGAIDDPEAYLSDYTDALDEAETEYAGESFGVPGCLAD